MQLRYISALLASMATSIVASPVAAHDQGIQARAEHVGAQAQQPPWDINTFNRPIADNPSFPNHNAGNAGFKRGLFSRQNAFPDGGWQDQCPPNIQCSQCGGSYPRGRYAPGICGSSTWGPTCPCY